MKNDLRGVTLKAKLVLGRTSLKRLPIAQNYAQKLKDNDFEIDEVTGTGIYFSGSEVEFEEMFDCDIRLESGRLMFEYKIPPGMRRYTKDIYITTEPILFRHKTRHGYKSKRKTGRKVRRNVRNRPESFA